MLAVGQHSLLLPSGQVHTTQNGTLEGNTRIANKKWMKLFIFRLTIWHLIWNKKLTSRDRARPWRRPGCFQYRRCCRTSNGTDAPYGSRWFDLLQFNFRLIINYVNYFEICKITDGEGAGLAAVLVPEAITETQILEGVAHDATKDGTDHWTLWGLFGNTGRPQIDIINGVVERGVLLQGVVSENTVEVVPVACALHTAHLTEGVVTGLTVFTTTLYVQWSQISTELSSNLREQVVGQLLRYTDVESLNKMNTIKISLLLVFKSFRLKYSPERFGWWNQSCTDRTLRARKPRMAGWIPRSNV